MIHSQPAKQTILVVDDKPANLTLLSTLLTENGYLVRAAANPELALQSAFAYPPSLILLDVNMPDMDGFEMCRRLKQDLRTQEVPIIFVSGLNDISMRVGGFEVGGVDYISKPFMREEILARVRAHLELRQARSDLEQRVRERTAELETKIHELSETKEILETTEQRFRDLVNSTEGIVWEADAVTIQFTFVSRQAERLLGYPVADWLQPGFWLAHLHPDDRAWAPDYCVANTRRLEPHDFEYRFIAQDGRTVWLRDIVSVVAENGAPRWLRGVTVDITRQRQTEADLRVAAVAMESQEGMMVTGPDNVILRVNRAFTEITGYAAEEVVGRNPNLLQSGRHNRAFYAAMWNSLQRSGAWKGEIWNRRKNGEIYAEYLSITAVKGQNGTLTHYVSTFNDITPHKQAQERIQHLAFYDELTGLPNRRLLIDRLRQALAANARRGLLGALLFIDMDNFKALNETLGHDTGDLLLKQIAERLTACMGEGDTVARLGGDEFVVLLVELGTDALDAGTRAETVGEKIRRALSQPYQLDTQQCHSTPSIGVTLFNGHDHEVDELFKQADIAMYQAKQAGRNALRFFDPQMQAKIASRVALENSLRHALAENQFHLLYQAQVEDNGRIIGAEALIRWRHPGLGVVSPGVFIPLAEESGLILSIGQWVLETACAQLKAWQQTPEFRHLVLAVNVSAKQFHQEDFVAKVKSATAGQGIDPQLLKLEVTESMLLDDMEGVIARMNALKEIGVQLSLDDFGTGYSSLQYLKHLPLNQLKIDRSFVCDLAIDSSDEVIVRTIIAMAHSLNLDVIAEGVETEAQRQILFANGCFHYQGYLFSKPLPVTEFHALAALAS